MHRTALAATAAFMLLLPRISRAQQTVADLHYTPAQTTAVSVASPDTAVTPATDRRGRGPRATWDADALAWYRMSPAQREAFDRDEQIRAARPRGPTMAITGALILGLSYGLTLTWAGATATNTGLDAATAWLLVPVVGPFITGAVMFAAPPCGHNTLESLCRGLDMLGAIFPLMDGAVQLAGAVMLGVGIARANATPSATPSAQSDRRAARWMISPGAAGAPAGATFTLLHL
jgi:hypothetical protein